MTNHFSMSVLQNQPEVLTIAELVNRIINSTPSTYVWMRSEG